MKGLAIGIDGNKYWYDQIKSLPFGLSISNVKRKQTPDEIAFTGPHTKLSNMNICLIRYNHQNYDSVERAYHHIGAMRKKDFILAQQIISPFAIVLVFDN